MMSQKNKSMSIHNPLIKIRSWAVGSQIKLIITLISEPNIISCCPLRADLNNNEATLKHNLLTNSVQDVIYTLISAHVGPGEGAQRQDERTDSRTQSQTYSHPTFLENCWVSVGCKYCTPR